MKFYFFNILLFLGIFLVACTEDEPLFEKMEVEKTGLEFTNQLDENANYNILTYEYFYNGSGLGVGDFNNDGLADIYLSGNQVANKLFLNTGDFHFKDITKAAGIKEKAGWKTGVSVADINGDGLLDIYLCFSGNGPKEGNTKPVIPDYEPRANQLFINQGVNSEGIPVFSEEAEDYGLAARGTFSTQAYFFDYDLDGDFDMFLLNHANRFYNTLLNVSLLRKRRHPYFGNKLFKNNNGKFVEVSDEAGIDGPAINFGLSAAISDLNLDGYPDIFVTNDYSEQDFFYINNGDGTFREVSKKTFGHLSKFSMGSDVADLNNDLKADIFVADMLPEDNYRQKILKGQDEYDRTQMLVDSGYHHQYMHNNLHLNQGLATDSLLRFKEIAQLAGVSNTDWSWAPLLADFDNDGQRDLFITNGFLRDFSNLDFVNFTVNEYISNAQQNRDTVNLGKLVKEMPSTKVANYMFQNTGETGFENVSVLWGFTDKTVSNAAAYADFDNDGDLDLVVNNNNAPVMLYQNKTQKKLGNNFLKLKLNGNNKNTLALGAKVYVTLENNQIFQEAYYTRGYQSTMEPVMTLGLGKNPKIKKLQVIWPNGKQTVLENIAVNQTLSLNQKEAQQPYTYPSEPVNDILPDITEKGNIDFVHTENDYVDFYNESLIPYQLSKLGGRAVVGDINADGNDDIYLAGARGQKSRLYLGKADATFNDFSEGQPFFTDEAADHEDMGGLFFDADGDGDLDLYVLSGGNEEFNGTAYYQDRLYINDGKGVFSEPEGVLPDTKFSGGVVRAADYDQDGDLDLFVGGRVSGRNYPLTPRSSFLRNDSSNGQVKFVLENRFRVYDPGMVTDAVWEDLDGDSYPELILSGEWMPITIYKNANGILTDATAQYGLENSNGWWFSLAAGDFDADGDVDFLAGNLGNNTQFKASAEEPMHYYIQDIDNNGRIDPIISYYIQGKSYPLPSRDELLGQVPSLKKNYLSYDSYAKTTMEQLLQANNIEPRSILTINTLKSSLIENQGNGTFIVKPLPYQAQESVIQGFEKADFNGDGKEEILAAGNLFPFRVELGKMDASSGFMMDFINGNMEVFTQGLWLSGDVRDLHLLSFASGKKQILVTRNNGRASIHKLPHINPSPDL